MKNADRKPLCASEEVPTELVTAMQTSVFNVALFGLRSRFRTLSTMPGEDAVEQTPEGIRVELKQHQKHALAWMLWREKQTPPCGILADDMGLGKTLSLISLIVYRKQQRLNKIADPDYERAMQSAFANGRDKILIVLVC